MGTVRDEIDRRLEPWFTALAGDRTPYTNHVLRVLEFCDALYAVGGGSGAVPSSREEYLTAGAFHDLGIWSAGTFDYLGPSAELARDWLSKGDRTDLVPLVDDMIDQHHKLRAAADPHSPVEIFRRADTIDVLFGARRFGMSMADYRRIASTYPDAGFHVRLVTLTAGRVRTNPLSPLPMFKW